MLRTDTLIAIAYFAPYGTGGEGEVEATKIDRDRI